MTRDASERAADRGGSARATAWPLFATAALAALAWVVAVDLVTGSTPPMWDALSYVDVAEHGIAGNAELVAPFAYRPAIPYLARWVARAIGADVATGFEVVTRVACFATLVLAWRLARSLGARARVAFGVQALAALAYFHLRQPLFFPTLVDAGAYPVLLAAFSSLATRRYGAALAIGLVGLAFKEFLLVPCGVLAWMLARERRFAFAALVVVATAATFAGIRAAIPVARSQELVDRSSLANLWTYAWWVPLRFVRDANLVFAFASYFLPVLVLATPARVRAMRTHASPRVPWSLALTLVALLALYGGTNVSTFASYALPVSIAAVCALDRSASIATWEWCFALAATAAFNGLFRAIPDPATDFGGYVDFYGGWATRWSSASTSRAVAIVACIAVAWVVRATLARRRA